MIPYLEHHIVDHCNLKCNGCSHFSGMAKEWYEDIADFTKDFTELKNKTNGQVAVIRLMGGEPLLHPNVKDFLITARQLFPYSEIQLVTNGILFNKRKEELLDTINNNYIVLCISNYGLKNIDFYQLVHGVQYYRIDAKTDMYNICLDLKGNHSRFISFDNCDLHTYKWYYFQGGNFYPCCIGANVHIFNEKFGYNLPEPRGYSIYTYSEEEILYLLNQPIELCEYCDTLKRQQSYHEFSVSKEDIKEWICQ